jgi:hypothetical protein
MFDPRRAEAERVAASVRNAKLELEYVESPIGVHHYTIIRPDRNERYTIAQRLSANEAIAFIEGYRMGQRSNVKKREAS